MNGAPTDLPSALSWASYGHSVRGQISNLTFPPVSQLPPAMFSFLLSLLCPNKPFTLCFLNYTPHPSPFSFNVHKDMINPCLSFNPLLLLLCLMPSPCQIWPRSCTHWPGQSLWLHSHSLLLPLQLVPVDYLLVMTKSCTFWTPMQGASLTSFLTSFR